MNTTSASLNALANSSQRAGGSLTQSGDIFSGGLVLDVINGGLTQNANVTTSGSITITVANGLVMSASAETQSGTADIQLVTLDGDLVVGLISAGPPVDSSGAVSLAAGGSGSILRSNNSALNLQGRSVTLDAAANVGAEVQPMIIEVFAATEEATIILSAAGDASIGNVTNATVDDTDVGGSTLDITGDVVASAVAASTVSAVQDIVAIDWAQLDPSVTLIDCLEPCIRLPADQSEDEGLAELRDVIKLLLIRTNSGWKLIPVFAEATIAAN